MLKIRIIPCLDVKDGRTVKGVGFRDIRDAGDPVALARRYDADGADEICLLDIAASIEQRSAVLDTVSQIARRCFTPLTVGGGVRTVDDAVNLLRAGADKIAINSAALADPQHISDIARITGNQCVVVALDAKCEGNSWQLYAHGGTRPTGLNAIHFAAQAVQRGAGEILLTSIDRDGTGSGFDIALIRSVCAAVAVPVIASGGAGTAQDLVAPVVEAGASAVLAASMFHDGRVTLAEARAALAAAGAPVRRFPAMRAPDLV